MDIVCRQGERVVCTTVSGKLSVGHGGGSRAQFVKEKFGNYRMNPPDRDIKQMEMFECQVHIFWVGGTTKKKLTSFLFNRDKAETS